MHKKKIFILVGHPNNDTLTYALATSYENSALKAGHEVRRQNLADMQFDPILYKGYKAIQQLEPDLKTFQNNVKWAEHLVIVYPNWWSTMPASLKGLIDRAWLPSFAFSFYKKGPLKGLLWHRLLKGRTARVIIVANTPEFISYLIFGNFTNELSRGTLWFAGIKNKVTVFSPSESTSDGIRKRWLKRMATLGKRGE